MRPLILLLLVSLLAAQQPPQTASLQGNVIDGAGKPLAGVQVRLTGPAGSVNGQASQPAVFAAQTDASGKFLVDAITPGSNYRLTAQKAGYVAAAYGARFNRPNATPMTLRAGDNLTGITMVMPLQGIINGTVVDQEGQPVQGAMIVLMRQGFAMGARALQPISTWSTNDQGAFRIPGLVPGQYFLQAIDRLGVPISSATTANVNTYYPNTTDPKRATPIIVAAGSEQRGIDIRLQRGRIFSIRGKVVDENGTPLANMTGGVASAVNFDGSVASQFSRHQFNTRPDGTFVASGLPADEYLVQANSGSGGKRLTATVSTRVAGGDTEGVVVTLRPGISLSGRIHLETDSPGTQAVFAGLRPFLQDNTNRSLAGYPAIVDRNGAFFYQDIPPSSYLLDYGALPQTMYLTRILYRGEDVTHRPLDLNVSGSLELLVANGAGTISGIVRGASGEPGAGAVVQLWMPDPDPGAPLQGVRVQYTNERGEFQFRNLRPETYSVAAWETIDPGLISSRPFLHSFENDAVKLKVGEGEIATVRLAPISVAQTKAAEAGIP
jgi:protocatechuate 3,4-dioxygenase beta subunit